MLPILQALAILSTLAMLVSAQTDTCQMSSKMNELETAVMSLQRLIMCQADEKIKCDYPSDLQSRLAYLEATAQSVKGLQGGIHYTRWGRTSCPYGSDLLYKGFAAKNSFNSRGGGINFLCLPEEPEDPKNVHPGLQGNSYIHGTEYIANGLPRLMSHYDNYNDMPCALCETAGRGQVLMIPAKLTCPAGWSKEYDGYLMAEQSVSSHLSQSDYICVDEKFEFIKGGHNPQIRAQAMFVEVGCGILPCPPYKDGNELACVVCSK